MSVQRDLTECMRTTGTKGHEKIQVALRQIVKQK